MKIWVDLKVLLMASCLLAALHGAAAKRSGIGRRAKSSSGRSHSGRSNQQHHYAPQPAPKPAAPPKPAEAPKSASNLAAAPKPPAPKPAAPAANQQPIGWNVGSNARQNPGAPAGPPPPYPGASHYYPGIGGAPPAYSPRNAHPPSYSSLGHGQGYPHQSYSPYQQQHAPQMSHAADSSKFYGLGATNFGPSHGHNPYMSSGYGGYGGQMGNPYAMGGMGGMGGHGYYPGAAAGFGGMGAAPMMGGGLYGGYQKPKSSLFSLSNILTGVALYGTVRSLSGGGWGGGYGGYGGGYGQGPREVHIYDHRERGKDAAESTAIQQAVGLPGTANVTYTASTPTPLAPYPVTGQTAPAEAPPEVVEDYTLPPLPADSEPKIYFGYGFAYGYGDYSVDSDNSSSSSASSASEEKTEANTDQDILTVTFFSEEDLMTESTDTSTSQGSQESS